MASLLTFQFFLEIASLFLFVWAMVKLYPIIRSIYEQRQAAVHFPSLPKHWLWGTLQTVKDLGRENFVVYLKEQTKRHKSKGLIFWRGGFLPELFLTHSKSVSELLKSSEPKPGRPSAAYVLSKPWLGDGLLISGGKKWERHRKLLTPAFHFNVLQPYMQVYNDVMDIFLTKLDRVSKTKESYEIFDPVALCTLDIMLRCALSYEGNIQESGVVHPYVKAVKRLTHLIATRITQPPMYIDFLYYLTEKGKEFRTLCDYVQDFADQIITQRRKTLAANPDALRKRHLDFLDILLAARDEDGVGLSKEDMRSEVDTFLFEGHDTTASASSWALYALAKHPHVQEKVFQEVTEVMGSTESVDWGDLNKLKYTGLFLKEVLRIYSPVSAISRQLTKPLIIDGVTIPKGMVVSASLLSVHSNSELWEDPEDFRPERFADEKYSSRDPFSFVPFSAGPRNCIGQNFAMNEEKVFVSRVVKRFRLEVDPDHPVIVFPELVTRAKHGIKLKFFARE